MDIAGHDVAIDGTIPDSDLVLLEDAVTFVLGRLAGAELREVVVIGADRHGPEPRVDGYDLALRFRGLEGRATLRRNARGDWRIRLSDALEDAVDDLSV